MPTKVREALRLLRADGWIEIKRRATSHRQFMHPIKPGKVTVAGRESEDLLPETWQSIQKQAGLR